MAAMLRHWLLTLAILSGLLSAPLAMAHERAAPPSAMTASHCADQGTPASDDGKPAHAPVKQFRCMGACFGVEANVAMLAPRVTPLAPVAAIPAMASLGDIVIAHDPPPPRPA
jgi:hypothetical protein